MCVIHASIHYVYGSVSTHEKTTQKFSVQAENSYGPGLFAVHAERQAEGRGEAGRTTAPIDGRPDHLDDDDGSQHWPLGAERGRRGPQPTSQRVAITWRRPAPQPAQRRTAPRDQTAKPQSPRIPATAHSHAGLGSYCLRVSGGSGRQSSPLITAASGWSECRHSPRHSSAPCVLQSNNIANTYFFFARILNNNVCQGI